VTRKGKIKLRTRLKKENLKRASHSKAILLIATTSKSWAIR